MSFCFGFWFRVLCCVSSASFSLFEVIGLSFVFLVILLFLIGVRLGLLRCGLVFLDFIINFLVVKKEQRDARSTIC